MKAFTLTTLLSASLASAATVTLQETACIQNNTNLETFSIPLDSLAVKSLPSVCGLKIVSADGADVNKVSCQAFKDAEGKDKGSAIFTFAEPARIATNPVQEGSIKCDSNGASASASVGTTVVTTIKGTGSPSASSGNGTVPTVTGGPTRATGASATGTGGPAPTGGAASVGLSVGAIAAGFAAFLL